MIEMVYMCIRLYMNICRKLIVQWCRQCQCLGFLFESSPNIMHSALVSCTCQSLASSSVFHLRCLVWLQRNQSFFFSCECVLESHDSNSTNKYVPDRCRFLDALLKPSQKLTINNIMASEFWYVWLECWTFNTMTQCRLSAPVSWGVAVLCPVFWRKRRGNH